MSGYRLAVADKFGFPARILAAPVVTTNTFVAGQARDASNLFSAKLGRGQVTEHVACNHIPAGVSVGTQLKLVMADKFGFSARALDYPVITVATTVDTTPVSWTTNPSLVTAQFTGGVYSSRPSKAATIFYVAVPVGDTAPTPQNVVDGKRNNGQDAIDKAFSVAASSAVTQTTLSRVTYDASDVRYTQVDVYATAVNVDGVLQASAYFVGTLTVDSAPTFSGNTAGSVNAATHEITLGPFTAATDQYDDPSALVYVAGLKQGSTFTPLYSGAPGATTMTFDPGVSGANDFVVRAVNTRGLMDTNLATVTLTLGNGSGSYQAKTGVLRNRAGSKVTAGVTVRLRAWLGGDPVSSPGTTPDIDIPAAVVGADSRVTFNCAAAGGMWWHAARLVSGVLYEVGSGQATAA